MSNLVRNESLKLAANWFNAASVAVIGAGVVAPIIYNFFGIGPRMDSTEATGQLTVICICVGAILHFIAQLTIGGLRDDQ